MLIIFLNYDWKVRIDSPSIVLANLRTAVVTVKPKLPLQQQSANPTRSTVQVFQVRITKLDQIIDLEN